jgi:hypothetical protein
MQNELDTTIKQDNTITIDITSELYNGKLTVATTTTTTSTTKSM